MKKMRQSLVLLTMMMLCISVHTATAQTYQQVTSAPADGDWTGTYVIGYGSQIFGGTVSSYHGSTADITVSGGTITSDVTDQCLVYISKAGTMASGTHAGENYYLVTFYQNNIWKSFTYSGSGLTTSSRSSSYSNSGSTSAEHVTSITNAERWYISFSSGKITLETTQFSGYYFMYSNYTTGSEYFYLTNSTAATSHKDLTIYKQVEDNNCSSGVYNQFLSATPYSGIKFHDEMPYAFAQKNSFNQIVYSKDLNIPQYIESIGFMYFHAASNVNISQKSKVIIYIGDTDASTYSDWVDVRDLTKVYEGPMNFNYAVNKKWQFTDFTFNQLDNCGGVYTHNTSKNLVVVIHDDSNVAESIGNRGFFYRTASNGVHLHNYSTNQIAVSEETGKPYIVSSGSDLSASSTANYPVAHFCGKDHWWQPYQVTTIPAENGSFTVSPDDDEVCENATVDLSATPDPNYDFVGFTVTRDSDGTEVPVTIGHPITECQFVMPDDDVTITATFTPHIYDNTRYLKKTDIDEAQWAGKYILGYYGGDGSTYAATATLSSGQLTGASVTMTLPHHDTITVAGSSKVFSIEYGGIMSGQTGQSAIHNDHPYYFIYYFDPSDGSKKYLYASSNSQVNFGTFTEDARPTSDSYKWCFYEYDGKFLIRGFYNSVFLKSLNSGSNHHTEVVSATVPIGPTPSTTLSLVHLYKWDSPTYAITTSTTGNGTLKVYGEVLQHSSGMLAYEGTSIIFRPVPESGYSLSYLRVTDSENNEVPYEAYSAGTFQFTMPDDEVTIYAEFAEQECTDATVSGATWAVETNVDTTYCRMPFPIRTNYGYKQYIYSDENLTDKLPSVITSIGFMYHADVSGQLNITDKNHIEVYLSDTESATLSDWVDINSQTKVYEGSMSFYKTLDASTTDQDKWKDFLFNNNGGKFIHDKTKNLVVTIIDRSGANHSQQQTRGFYTVNEGKVVSLNARGSYDYTFDGNGLPLSNGNSVTALKSFYHPSTHFCGANVYYVTCATGLANGSISASPSTSLTGDGTETVTITAVPETGYEVNTVTATNESTGATIALSGSGNTRTFTMPEANVTVTATFRPAGGGGDTWVDNVTTQPAGGFVIDNVTGDITINCAEGLAWLISYVNGYNGCVPHSLEDTTVTITQPTIDMFEHIWVPIGYSPATPFSGTFDGQCNVISGLHIDQDSYQEVDEVEDIFGPMKYAGMFGYTKDATIKNTFVFLGSNDDEHGHRDWMTCKHDGGYLGMLVGYGEDLDMEFCYAANALGAWGNLNSVGGLVGCAHSDNPSAHVIKASMANGHFFYKNTGPSIVNLGGLVGSSNIPVENCFAIPMDSRYCSAYTSNLSGFTAPTITNKGAIVGSAGATSDVTNVYSHPFATDGFDKIVGNATGTLSNTKWYAVDTCTTPYTNVTTFTKATERTYGSYSTNNTIDGTPFCDTLNSNIAANYGYKWITPPTTSVNGGYPLIVRPNDVAGSVLNSYDAKHHLNVLIYHDVNAMPSILQALDDGSKEGDNSSFGILMYSNGEFDADLEIPADANFFIDENVAVKQDGNGEINAAVGVTLDNSTGNGEMHRDWHMFSSAIAGGKIGINYGQQTSAYPTSTNLSFGSDYSLVQNDDAVYFPDGITVANGNDGTEFDIYSFYEPQYHWINLKRASGNHWHEDSNDSIAYGPNETTFIPGKGYLMALGNNTAADNNFMQAKGVLNNGLVTIPISAQGSHLKGYNLLGNPYQSYLDFNEFADVNASVLWNSGEIGNQAYLTYNADKGGFVEYLVDGNGVGFSQGAATTTNGFLHPHQGFFVLTKSGATGNVTFNNDMRSITGTSEYRDAQPHYPLVNLICTDSDGKKEVSIIEVERPSMAGSLKMKEMLNTKANMYVRWGSEDFSSMFIDHRPDYVPVWFKSVEEGVFTMTWSTANDNFGYLHLIDNLTGNDIDMLAAESYVFQSKPSDSKARFRLVFKPLGIEEETSTEAGENFAFINGSELVVNGEGELSLIDLNGRVLTTEYVSGQQSHIAMPEVAVGMYMLRLANSDGVKVQKIVVKK